MLVVGPQNHELEMQCHGFDAGCMECPVLQTGLLFSFLSVKGKRVMGDFIQSNGAWLLNALALVGGGGTAVIAYMLKSRCTVIKCCCISCERDVLPANVVAAEAV